MPELSFSGSKENPTPWRSQFLWICFYISVWKTLKILVWVRERNWNKQSSEEKRLNRVTTVVVLCSGAEKEESKVPTLVQFSASALGPATDEGSFPHHMLQVQVMGFRETSSQQHTHGDARWGPAMGNFKPQLHSQPCLFPFTVTTMSLSLSAAPSSPSSSLQRQVQPAHTLLQSPRAMVRSAHRYPRELVN